MLPIEAGCGEVVGAQRLSAASRRPGGLSQYTTALHVPSSFGFVSLFCFVSI